MDTVHERLKFIREEKYGKRGMTKFAQEVGISPSGCLNYERGDRHLPADVLIRIAKCTEVNLHWLLTGDGQIYLDREVTRENILRLKENGDITPLFKFAPATIDSLILTKPYRNLISDIIDKETQTLDNFQLTLHSDIIRGLDNFIERKAAGKIKDIPKLIKHSLIRATIGDIAAMLVPGIVHQLFEKDPQLALDYTRSMSNSLLNDKLTAYYAIIDRLQQRGKTEAAIDLIEEALEIAKRLDDPFEQMRSLLPIARWYAHCGELRKTHQIMTEVEEKLKPNIATYQNQSYESLVRFYRQWAETEAEIGRLDRAKQILSQAIDLAKKRLKDPKSINVHLSRCAVQYVHLSLKFIGKRQLAESERLLDQAKALIGQIDDLWHQVEALLTGIRSYYLQIQNPAQATHFLIQAIEIAKSISDPNQQSMALRRIIDGCVYDEEFELVESLAHEISDPIEASSALLNIAQKYLSRHNQDRARLLFNRALRLSEKSKDLKGRKETLCQIATRLLENREIHEALRVAQRTVVSDDKAISLLNFIRAIIDGKEEETLRQTPKSTKTKTVDQTRLLSQKAISLAESGHMNKASSTIAQALETSAQLNMPDNKVRAYSYIAQASAKTENRAQTFSCLQQALQNAAYSTRDLAIEVIEELIPVLINIGGVELLSEVYDELQSADEIFKSL